MPKAYPFGRRVLDELRRDERRNKTRAATSNYASSPVYGGGASLPPAGITDTDQLPEGALNLYFTEDRVLTIIQSAAGWYGGESNAGTDAYVATLDPVPAALATGQLVIFKADVENTGAATLNVNGLGAAAIVQATGDALTTGMIVAGQFVAVLFDGTQWQLLGAAGGGADLPVPSEDGLLLASVVGGEPVWAMAVTDNDGNIVVDNNGDIVLELR